MDDVDKTLDKLQKAGGSKIGEIIRTEYADVKKAAFVYATDCEGNIVELQSWL